MKTRTGSAREVIDTSELLQWQEKGAIITDDRRRRPLWFDGRFLDARALNAEQNYLGKGQSANDMRLMAHEATHVVQQGAADMGE